MEDKQTHTVYAIDNIGCYVGEALCDIGLIPDGCVAVKPLLDKEGFIAKWNGDNWEYVVDSRLMDVKKSEKIEHLNHAAQAFANSMAEINKVPDFEFASWSIQAVEAKAWNVDKNADTPVLNQIAASRGINADKLKAAALRKTLAYERLIANIAGQRQALQSKIERATDMAALEAIEIVFTEPEAV